MKRIIPYLLIFTILALFLIACGRGKKKQVTQETAPITETAQPINTIITSPQNLVIVIHAVSDYSAWKTSYDSHAAEREANGLHTYIIGRGLYDSSQVFVLLKADDMSNAKDFSFNTGIGKTMQKAGVKGLPFVKFLEAVWQDTAQSGSRPYAMTNFSVKDWDTWEKNFNEGLPEIADNGIMPKIIGHIAGNNKNVSLITSLSDTSRAFAYYRSDELKKRMKTAGLTREPERQFFQIVQRY